MRRSLPPLNPLRAFEALARLGSVASAADELNVTHGAISHQIRTLEEHLAMRLFLRDKRSLRLTPAGGVYARQVRQALRLIADSTLKLSMPAAEGRLYLRCPPAFASGWLAHELHDFRQVYPDIEIDLRPDNLDDTGIGEGDYDLAIVYGHGEWEQCSVRLLVHAQMYPVCHPRFFVSSDQPRQLNELQGRWLLHEDGGGHWKRWLAAVGINLAEIEQGTRFWDAQLTLQAASARCGVAIGDDVTCAAHLRHGRLVRLFDISVPAPSAYYLVCNPDRAEEPRILLFAQWIQERIGNSQIIEEN